MRNATGTNAAAANNAPIGRTQIRVLTLKQLKETIADIYAQKVKFDQKCEINKVSKETLEQYMYTYLNQKYGLKPLIVEWAAAIINGVKTYIKEEHDVALFAKMLKNECDESFRPRQEQVKDSLNKLLKEIVREKHPHKSEKDIVKVIEGIQKGRIDEWMWKKIIQHDYAEQDAVIIEDIIREQLESKSKQSLDESPSQASLKKMTRQELNQQMLSGSKESSKLLFNDFKKIILDFTL